MIAFLSYLFSNIKSKYNKFLVSYYKYKYGEHTYICFVKNDYGVVRYDTELSHGTFYTNQLNLIRNSVRDSLAQKYSLTIRDKKPIVILKTSWNLLKILSWKQYRSLRKNWSGTTKDGEQVVITYLLK